MAITSTRSPRNVAGGQKQRIATITFDSSYPTGGEPITAADLGLSSQIEFVFCQTLNAGYVVAWDGSKTAPKLKVFQQSAATSALTEVPNTTNLSTLVVHVLAFGF